MAERTGLVSIDKLRPGMLIGSEGNPGGQVVGKPEMTVQGSCKVAIRGRSGEVEEREYMNGRMAQLWIRGSAPVAA